MTNLKDSLDLVKGKEMYDGNIKRILSEKSILARILKETVEEVKDLDYDEIVACIGSEILIGKVRLENSLQGKIDILSEEDYYINEGKITYDIRFDFYLKKAGKSHNKDKKRIKLLINIEAQKKFNPGYDLVPRGIFYCARMISSQLGREIINNNYDDVCKVYSIWICMKTPKDVENAIFSYSLKEKMIYGKKTRDFRSDLLTVVMVCLPGEINEEHTLQNMLRVLLDGKVSPEKKEKILFNEYGIEMNDNMKKEARYMCNLSDLVEERGIQKGMEKGIGEGRRLQIIDFYKDGVIDKEKALELLKISEDELNKIIENGM